LAAVCAIAPSFIEALGQFFHKANRARRSGSPPGSTGKSIVHGQCLLDRPVKPGGDKHGGDVIENELRPTTGKS
jgi:hypothetical protein